MIAWFIFLGQTLYLQTAAQLQSEPRTLQTISQNRAHEHKLII